MFLRFHDHIQCGFVKTKNDNTREGRALASERTRQKSSFRSRPANPKNLIALTHNTQKMQFIDVTRVFRLVVGDNTTEDMLSELPNAKLYKLESYPEDTTVGAAIIQTNEKDFGMFRAMLHTADKNQLRRRQKALINKLKNTYKKHGWTGVPNEKNKECDTDLVEICAIREVLYGEPVKVVSDLRPDLLKNINSSTLTPEDVRQALKASGMKATTKQALGCALCGLVTGDLKKCGKCKSVLYCSAECQKKDWPVHKLACSSF